MAAAASGCAFAASPRRRIKPTAPSTTPSEVTYTFQQEFNDPAAPLLRTQGGPFNPYFTYWGGEAQPDGPPGHRWFNDDLQVLTTSQYPPAPFNPFTVANGVLTIEGRPALPDYPNSPKPYVSGLIETANDGWWLSDAERATKGGFEQKYGYWEARIKIPDGQGLWPAFWLEGGIVQGQNNNGRGELDIFETVGDGKLYQTVHDFWSTVHVNESTAYQPPFNYWEDFHVYGLKWTSTEIVWYVDGVETKRASQSMVAKFRDQSGPMHLIIGFGMGGPNSWPGAPDDTTPWPARMDIDYVRVRSV